MIRMPFKRPTTYYDERVNKIDEQLCKLIKERKEISNNNPGFPPLEYISNWAKKFELYEDLLKSLFGAFFNEERFRPTVEPEGFRKNLPVLKSIEIDDRIFSVITIRQYSNSSIVNFNIDWDNIIDPSEPKYRYTHFELFIGGQYDCHMRDGARGDGHFHYNFTVSPALPDNISGIELIFKEYNSQVIDKQIGHDIVIRL